MRRKTIKTVWITALLVLACSASPVFAETVLPMSVIPDVRMAYENFLAEKGQTVFEIRDLRSEFADRQVACMVIIMQALKLGGYDARLEPVEAPNAAREIQMLKNGETVIMHQDVWDAVFDDSVFKSSVFIPDGRFEKGFYVAEGKEKDYTVKGLDDLRNYSAVSSRSWRVDWGTLEKIDFKNLLSATTEDEMFKLVLLRNIDFTFQEFKGSRDMAYETDQGRLVPLPDVKLILNGTRHIMVSKIHPEGRRVYPALEAGLKVMRENGTIDAYLREAGFYNPRVADWKAIRVGE